MHSHRAHAIRTLIHSVTFLISYDSWLSSSDVEREVEEPPLAERPWRVRIHVHEMPHTKNSVSIQMNNLAKLLRQSVAVLFSIYSHSIMG